MNPALHLDMVDVVEERPFTHPDHVCLDRAAVCRLIDELCWKLETLPPTATETSTTYFPNSAKWQKRMVIPNPSRLMTPRSFAIVGFFGCVRQNIPQMVRQQISEGDRQLVDSFVHFPAVLAYASRLLPDELNYVNLVVLDNDDAIMQWRDYPPHPYLTDVVSPDFYEYVRIYNGRLPIGGLQNSSLLQFMRVKYWDYRVSPTWHAVRRLQ
ncbi:MAG: hypothetical protein R3C62_20105 [Chloroflexota bacterium]